MLFYEIMWKNIVEPDRLQMTIWRTRIACWIPKAINTHSQCVILIAFLHNSGCRHSPQCYFIRTLPVLFLSICDNYLSYLFALLLINAFYCRIPTACHLNVVKVSRIEVFESGIPNNRM